MYVLVCYVGVRGGGYVRVCLGGGHCICNSKENRHCLTGPQNRIDEDNEVHP